MPWPPHKQTTADLLAQAELIPLIPDYPKNFIPPSFTDPNYVPVSQQDVMRDVAIVTCCIASVFVFARLFVRYRGKVFGWDDWVVIPAYMSFLGYVYCQATFDSGIGFHAYDLAMVDIVTTLKLVYTFSLCWTATLHLTRISVLFLFLRLSSATLARRTRTVIIGMIWFCFAFMIITLCVIAFDCQPISVSFDLKAHLTGHCHAFLHVASYYTLAAGHIFLDGIVILLPIPMISKLAISKTKRINLYVLLMLGAVSMVCSAVRMYVYYGRMARGWDFTWEAIPTAIWGQIEASIALIITSLPSLNRLLVKFFPCFNKCSSTIKNSKRSWFSRNATPVGDLHLKDLSSTSSTIKPTLTPDTNYDLESAKAGDNNVKIKISHSVSVTSGDRAAPKPITIPQQIYVGVQQHAETYDVRAGRSSVFSSRSRTDKSPCRLQQALGKRYGSWGSSSREKESFEEIHIGDEANFIMMKPTKKNASQETILGKS